MALADTVKTLVDNLGAVSCVMTRETQGAYNTATSQYASGTTTSYTFNAAPDEFDQFAAFGDNLRLGDVVLYVSPASITVTPVPGDRITFNSEEWLVVEIRRTNFKGADALWTLQVRRS